MAYQIIEHPFNGAPSNGAHDIMVHHFMAQRKNASSRLQTRSVRPFTGASEAPDGEPAEQRGAGGGAAARGPPDQLPQPTPFGHN